jgi:flagellar biosynthetic protein FliQ
MGSGDVGAALQETMWLLAKIGGPLLIAALLTGLLVSLVQAVTQINEPTLVFLPKLVVLGATLLLLGPFITDQLNAFALLLMDRLVAAGGQ